MAEVDHNWSPEYTAYKLMLEVTKTETDIVSAVKADKSERQYVLDTYAECLAAVQGKRAIAKTFVRAT